MRIREERKAEKEWRRQEIRDRRREENRQKGMEERKCFWGVEVSAIWLITAGI